jgi:hypothetical protein
MVHNIQMGMETIIIRCPNVLLQQNSSPRKNSQLNQVLESALGNTSQQSANTAVMSVCMLPAISLANCNTILPDATTLWMVNLQMKQVMHVKETHNLLYRQMLIMLRMNTMMPSWKRMGTTIAFLTA